MQHVVTIAPLDWLDPPDDWEVWWQDQAPPAIDLANLRWILAADCVFEEHLTEAWMRAACALMACQSKLHRGQSKERARLLVSVEKRPVFLAAHQRIGSYAYDSWRTLFREEQQQGDGSVVLMRDVHPQGVPLSYESHPVLPLVGRQVDLSQVPQRISQYTRSPELEVWELELDTLGGVWERYLALSHRHV